MPRWTIHSGYSLPICALLNFLNIHTQTVYVCIYIQNEWVLLKYDKANRTLLRIPVHIWPIYIPLLMLRVNSQLLTFLGVFFFKYMRVGHLINLTSGVISSGPILNYWLMRPTILFTYITHFAYSVWLLFNDCDYCANTLSCRYILIFVRYILCWVMFLYF